MINLDEIEERNKKRKKMYDQYYYVNQSNHVQLIYPNYEDKSKNYLAQDKIIDINKIRQVYSKEYKKVIVIKNNDSNYNMNSLRKIPNLKK